MKYPLPILAFIVFCMGCHAQSPHSFNKQNNSNSLLWEVSGNGLDTPSFLFGTFHLLCKDDLHFSDALRQAVAGSKEVYMELDMDDPSMMLQGMMYMTMKKDTTLADLYTPAEYERVKKFFSDSIKMPVNLLQNVKPYFLVALLYPKMMHCTTPTAVEEELVKIAKTDKKEVKGLETFQFQASVFDTIPYRWQARELLKNIDSFSVYKKQFETMLDFYKQQKMDSIAATVNTGVFDENKYDDILLKNRNMNWVKQLDTIMRKESVFVAVGAGHLPGPDGLISLLRKQGFNVEPIVNK